MWLNLVGWEQTGAENDKRGEDFGKHLAAMSMHVHHSEKGEKPDYHVTYAPIQVGQCLFLCLGHGDHFFIC